MLSCIQVWRESHVYNKKEKGLGLYYIIMDEFIIFAPQRGFWSSKLGWTHDLSYAEHHTEPKQLVLGFSCPVELIPASACQQFNKRQLAAFLASLLINRCHKTAGLPKRTLALTGEVIIKLDEPALIEHLMATFATVSDLIELANTFVAYNLFAHSSGRTAYIVPSDVGIKVALAPKTRSAKPKAMRNGRHK